MASKVMDEFAGLPPLMSVEDTCRLLGLSRSAGYRAVAAGQIPTMRVGRRLYVPTPRLLNMLGAVAPEVQPGRASTVRG
jgi:excisionase family DNA binding protein